jgi:hypothetical protein
MFLLPRDKLPATPDALAEAIEEALRPFASRREQMVTVRGTDLRNLDSIAVDLSGAIIDPHHRPRIPKGSESEPAISVRELSITAEPVSVLDNQLTFRLDASNVDLDQRVGSDGKVLLLLRNAGSGNIRFAAARAQLEGVIAKAAAIAAGKQGVTIETVQIDLRPRAARTVDVRVTVTARKLFFRAILHLTGSIAISDDLVATVSDLRCDGDGTIAALACAAITSYFTRIEQRPFPLSALTMGEVRVQDVALAVENDQIVVTARFGSDSKKER